MASHMGIEPAAAVSHDEQGPKPEIRQRVWGRDARGDPTVSYPEFAYWAKVERAEEVEGERKYRELQGPWTFKKMIKARFSKGAHHEKKKLEEAARREQGGLAARDTADEKAPDTVTDTEGTNTISSRSSMRATEEEWRTAARALRTASWGSVFYLITTDVLGWIGCP